MKPNGNIVFSYQEIIAAAEPDERKTEPMTLEELAITLNKAAAINTPRALRMAFIAALSELHNHRKDTFTAADARNVYQLARAVESAAMLLYGRMVDLDEAVYSQPITADVRRVAWTDRS
jgi:3-deoxy-D-arabino-heptulosonate 7-phosphate (DAHP) synthase class II